MTKVEGEGAPWPGALAVSGGGDSMALMLLAVEWAKKHSRAQPVVLTVDHGLRPHSMREAYEVIRRAQAAGLHAHVLPWHGPKPSSDIEAAARDARYNLLGAWCSAHGVAGLYLAHTLDDQAETFLLRLARGSGLDGLAAMRSVSDLPSPRWNTVKLVRPLLAERRQRLRSLLKERGEAWLEDPLNRDPRFARTRLRSAWPVLKECGLSPERIAAAASHLARARQALDEDTRSLLARACRFDGGSAVLDAAAIAAAPAEVALRCLAFVLMRVSGRVYRPRFERLQRLYSEIVGPCGLVIFRTLHGCRLGPARKIEAVFGCGTLRITPEKRRPANNPRGN
jgi:tRNA(Ile)-lysidine synthase